MSEKPKADGWLAVDKSEFLKEEAQSPSLRVNMVEGRSNHKSEPVEQNEEPKEQINDEESPISKYLFFCTDIRAVLMFSIKRS